MKNSKSLKIIFAPLISFCSSLSLILGVSISNPDYEKTCFQNAAAFAKSNNPIQTLSFQYTPKNVIGENVYKSVNDLINSIDGGSKYYNYACLWGETDKFRVLDSEIKLADISYNEENPVFSTNFLQLKYPSDYSEAFKNSNEFTFSFNLIEFPFSSPDIDQVFLLECFLNSEHIDNAHISFESENPDIACVDLDGIVKAKSVGETIINAHYLGHSASIDVIVRHELDKTIKTYNYAKAVVPMDIAEAICPGNYISSVDSILELELESQKYYLRVCGIYDPNSQEPKFRNVFYSENYSNYIYFLRDSSCYFPITNYCLTIGTDNNINMNLYSDMQLFKAKTNSVFSIPTEKIINNSVLTINELNITIFNILSILKSKTNIFLAIILSVCGLSFFIFLLYLLVFMHCYRDLKTLVAIYIGGIILPLLLLKTIKTISVGGILVSPLNSFIGWAFIVISVAFGLFLTLNIIKGTRNFNDTQSNDTNTYVELDI